MAEEAFEIHTVRGRVGDKLRKLWSEKRNTEPDLVDISRKLDEIGPREEQQWIDKARAALGL